MTHICWSWLPSEFHIVCSNQGDLINLSVMPQAFYYSATSNNSNKITLNSCFPWLNDSRIEVKTLRIFAVVYNCLLLGQDRSERRWWGICLGCSKDTCRNVGRNHFRWFFPHPFSASIISAQTPWNQLNAVPKWASLCCPLLGLPHLFCRFAWLNPRAAFHFAMILFLLHLEFFFSLSEGFVVALESCK